MKKITKCIVAFLMAVITLTLVAAPVSATWTYPDGGTLSENLISGDKLNKTIYVYHKDSSGNLLKYFEYKTKITDYDVFGDSLYGYDKKMIVSQLFSRIEVGRDYKVNCVMNFTYKCLVGAKRTACESA